ncbi:Vegetative incompatibility protein HET-E-1 [Colletotrichum sp. SAR11_239]|nr:Vegetative incompatibility protein HET-E-1 [Colletotrichum sp. SAR11_239]
MDENRPIRLLSLDGGGIRGVSSILVLKEVMRQVNVDRKPEDHLQPWQVFDLIGGTSTGGIIALMLGCLRMTLYKDHHVKCKSPPAHVEMEFCLIRFARFVATVRADDEELLLLRSYVNKQQPDVHSAKFEMWEALRATSAASTYFKEYRRGNEGYVDGAFKSNNPIFEVHHEATDLWPGRDMFLTVLSRFLVDILSRQASEATVCYFFFKAGEEGRHHSHQALCAILHQVFKEHAKALNFAMKEYSSSDSKNFTQNIEKLWDILCETSDSLSNRQIIVIIDALDECSEVTRNRFIDLLVSTFPQMIGSRKLLGRLKIIVTSRPWPSIETRFRYLSCVRLRGENETSSLSRDIEMMVQAKVGKLRVEGTITPEACSILETTLAQGADRTFLWASLVLETISKLPSRKLSAVKSTLEDTPADLDQLYETALLDVEDHVAVTRMLQIVLAATRPLTLDEINMAMCISSTHRTVQDLLQDLEPDMEYTVKQLGGFFLRIINSTVHLVGMALQAAASLEIVKALVETGVDLGQRYLCPTNGEMDLTSVLFSALRWGGLPKLEYLVNMGAGCLKETILSAAIEGHVDYLKVLLAAPDERSSEERFLDLQAVLKAATERGAVYARRFLMDFGIQEPEGTDISAGLAFAVMHGCNAEDVLALFEDGARDINGAALLSRAAFGEMGGIQTLFSVFEYPVEILNAALATFFTTNLDNETKNFLLKTIERSLSSSSHNRRVSNGFTIQPLIGQNYETNVIFLTTLSGKGARMPPAMFHQVLCWTIAMDEQLAAFLLQNRRSLQDDGDMFGACEYLALACLWGRPTIIRHLSGRDTGQDVTGISYDLLFRAVTVSGNAEALDALLDNRCIDSGNGAADKFAGKEFLDQWAVVEKVLGLKDSTASPLDLAARLGYQDVMAKLLSAKMVVRSRTAE